MSVVRCKATARHGGSDHADAQALAYDEARRIAANSTARVAGPARLVTSLKDLLAALGAVRAVSLCKSLMLLPLAFLPGSPLISIA